MQPYFFPYIGYWQLINAVDKFVVYDNIKFTKNSWIRRNRILVESRAKLFTLPIKNDSDYLDVCERYLSQTYKNGKKKLLNQIKSAYKQSSQFETVYSFIEELINYENDNLFEYIYNSIIEILKYLNVDTEIFISSRIDVDHSLKNKFRVMAICKALGGDVYINPIGGVELYDRKEFSQNCIGLKFLRTKELEYEQFDAPFIPDLSMIDVMMFNNVEQINQMLGSYELV